MEGFDPVPPEEYAVPPAVVGEIMKGRAAARLQSLLSAGLMIIGPSSDTWVHVRGQAEMMGEAERMSPADLDVLALAIDLGVPCVTDDYSLQNVAAMLNVPTIPFKQPGINEVWTWELRCKGCGRRYPVGTGAECPVCGSPLRSARKG